MIRPAAFVVKAAIDDPAAATHVFAQAKTMYGGRMVAAGDVVFLFASENAGGCGLVARGVGIAVELVARTPGIERETPRVTIVVRRAALASRRLGRAELCGWHDWDDGRPETELNFKLYRQATDKVVGITAAAADFLACCCAAPAENGVFIQTGDAATAPTITSTRPTGGSPLGCSDDLGIPLLPMF